MNPAMESLLPLKLMLVFGFVVTFLLFTNGRAAASDGNLFANPTFEGAEKSVPPPGWTLYQRLDESRKISVLHPDEAERRALIIEDYAATSGAAGEIGLYQTVSADPGRYWSELEFRALEDAPRGTFYFQLRFLPSQERRQLTIVPEQTERFEKVTLSGVAPEGTTGVRVYLFSAQSSTGAIAVRSMRLFRE